MKQVLAVILFLLILFPAVSDEYKVCYSSVTLKENAEYIARGLENNGVKTVFEPTVVYGRDYIRILSAETWDSLQDALTVKNTLAGKTFIRRLGLDSPWIRAYPEGYPASGFVFTDIPDIPEPRPVQPARAAAPAAESAPAAVPAARPAPPAAPANPPESPAGVPEITAAPPKPEAAPAAEPPAVPESPAEEPEAEPDPMPDIPEPAAAPVSEPGTRVEPEAEPVTEEIPEVVEEAPEPAAPAAAEVTIAPKAAPETPASSKPEVPAVEDSAPPAAPKAAKEVPASLTPPATEEEPAEPITPAAEEERSAEQPPEEVPEEEPVVEQPAAEEPAPVEEPAEAAAPEAEPVTEQPVAEEPAAAGPPSTEADDVFAFHRDNFAAAYEYLRTFADEGSSDEAVRLAKSIPLFLKAAEAALSDFAEYLPDPLSNYEKENPEAKEIRLSSKASFLENTYIPRARENLASLKDDILAAMESDAEWLASEYANIKHAPAALERIKDNAETLKTIASEDAELLSRAGAVLSEAEESYAALSERIADNRMPADKYGGDDAAQLKAEMAVLYEALFPGEMVKQVVIVSEDWREEASAEIRDGRIVAGVYKYIQAALAVTREGDENAAVYTIGFRRTWTGSGDDFGPVELYSIGSSYPILPEHIGE